MKYLCYLALGASTIFLFGFLFVLSQANTGEQEPASGFLPELYKTATASIFWVGEEAGEDNLFIDNKASFWDKDWLTSFGGVDDPFDRCGWRPCAFVPRENPFYFALPYADLLSSGEQKWEAVRYFDSSRATNTPLVKNLWAEIAAGERVCYGQWQDVGPFESDDFAYVFGVNSQPKNSKLLSAGIDLSPALRDCLLIGESAQVSWRLIDIGEVPDGPWKDTITESGLSW